MKKVTIYEKESIYIPPLNGSNPIINVLFSGLRHFPEANVLVIPYGKYWGGKDGIIFDANDQILQDSCFKNPQQAAIPFHVKTRLFSAPFYGNVAVLDNVFSANYYHCMFDVIARFDLIRKANIPIDKYVFNFSLPFQDELLDLLGIPPEKRIYANPNVYVKAYNLIVPSFSLTKQLLPPRYAVNFLRNEFLAKRNVKRVSGYERIYISREKATHRKIINEKDVLELLERKGFRKVLLEDEPVARKIEIFHSADFVVGPHGAGLTNLLFCNPGTKVIEIFNQGWVLQCFRLISHYVGLNYHYSVGINEKKRTDFENLFVDIQADIDHLSHLIDAL